MTADEYWVYIDKPTSEVRLHKAGCRHCNSGQGVHGHHLPDNWWTGFDSYDKALIYARKQARELRTKAVPCDDCNPLGD